MNNSSTVFDAMGSFYAAIYDQAWIEVTSNSSLVPPAASLTLDDLDLAARNIQQRVGEIFLEKLREDPSVRRKGYGDTTQAVSVHVSSLAGVEELSNYLSRVGIPAAPSRNEVRVAIEDPLGFIQEHLGESLHCQVRIEIPEWSITPLVGDEILAYTTETQRFGRLECASPSGVTTWLDYLEQGRGLSDSFNFVAYVSKAGERLELRYLPTVTKWAALYTDRAKTTCTRQFSERVVLEELVASWFSSGPASVDTSEWRFE